MASTINASTSSGLVNTADTSGILQLQTASTAALTIDASQNVGIGTASPAASTKLTINGSNDQIYLRTADTNAVVMSIGNAAGNSVYFQSKATGTGTALPFAWYMGGTQSMTLDTSGNLGIGTTSPSSFGKFAVTAASGTIGNLESTQAATNANLLNLNATQTNSSAGIRFQVNSGTTAQARIQINGDSSMVFQNTSSDTERMRIDSSGNLLVGQTTQTSSEKFGVTVSGSNSFAYFRSTGTSGNPTVFRISTGNLSGGIGSGNFIYCDDGGSAKFYVVGGGSIYSTNTSISAISDQRLKENIRDLETGLTQVMALKPRRFDWKEGEGTGEKNVAGFIAQEVETVLSDLVGEWKHNPEEETVYKSLQTGNMIPTLVKAIQELKAINDTQAETINALTARIVALEK